MNSDILINQVLLNISKKSGFSQGLNISFETTTGWTGFIKLWLFPYFYEHGTPRFEYSWNKNSFKEILLAEKEPNFSNWKDITFTHTDVLDNYIISLKGDKPYEPHRSHYSGHLYVSWMDFIDTNMKKIITIDVGDMSLDKIDQLMDRLIKKTPLVKQPLTRWQRFKKWCWNICDTLGYM